MKAAEQANKYEGKKKKAAMRRAIFMTKTGYYLNKAEGKHGTSYPAPWHASIYVAYGGW